MTTKRKTRPRKRSKTPQRATPRKRAPWSNVKKGAAPVVTREALRALGIVRPGALGDTPLIGKLGRVEVKLTKAEEKILSEPVPMQDVEVRGDGAVFLSHPAYTRWFNRAFGRFGWGLVPAARPRRERGDVLCDYVLFIHGKPAAFATGRQDEDAITRAGNGTYGDALESTVASALRRCAKRLGVGLELWDRKFCDAFLEQRCVRVWRKSERLPQYRLMAGRPFYDEKGPVEAGGGRMDERRAPAAGHDGRGNEKISQKQVGRLVGICRRVGRHDDEVKPWLKKRYGITSRKDIKRRDYDAICSAIEANRPLPASREPGEEG